MGHEVINNSALRNWYVCIESNGISATIHLHTCKPDVTCPSTSCPTCPTCPTCPLSLVRFCPLCMSRLLRHHVLIDLMYLYAIHVSCCTSLVLPHSDTATSSAGQAKSSLPRKPILTLLAYGQATNRRFVGWMDAAPCQNIESGGIRATIRTKEMG